MSPEIEPETTAVAQRLDFMNVPVRRKTSFLPAIHKHKVIARAFPFLKLKRHVTKVMRSAASGGTG